MQTATRLEICPIQPTLSLVSASQRKIFLSLVTIKHRKSKSCLQVSSCCRYFCAIKTLTRSPPEQYHVTDEDENLKMTHQLSEKGFTQARLQCPLSTQAVTLVRSDRRGHHIPLALINILLGNKKDQITRNFEADVGILVALLQMGAQVGIPETDLALDILPNRPIVSDYLLDVTASAASLEAREIGVFCGG